MNTSRCPECQQEGTRVKLITVKNLVEGEVSGGDYSACLSPACGVAYFSSDTKYMLSELNSQVWYKDQSDENSPICYCSNLTRSEIKEAVAEGCETIAEIRKKTGKTLTGNCLTENPLGRCCHKAIEKEIERFEAT